MLYEFELGHNAMEATKNMCCAKGESTVTRWFMKFWSDFKNYNNQIDLKLMYCENCTPSHRGYIC